MKQRDFEDVTYKEVHDTIFPADIRDPHLIYSTVRLRGSTQDHRRVRVWKLSPLGIEFMDVHPSTLKSGDELELQIQVGRQSTSFEGSIVAVNSHRDDSSSIVGVRLYRKQQSRFGDTNRRNSTRWICSSQFYPVAVAPNPIQFNDFIYFRVKDISSAGIRVLTSLRNKFIIAGMDLELQLSLPMTGNIATRAKVARARLTAEDGKDFLELGLEFDQLTKHHRQVLGQYVLQFSDAESLDAIRKQGLLPKSVTSGVDYSYVKSEADFKSVLDLRLEANLDANKVSKGYTSEDMSDIHDSRSRILIGKYHGRVVGTMRAIFSQDNEKFEIEQFTKLPETLHRRDQVVEIGRAATSPAYRRSDLWYSMIQHISIMAVQAGRPYGVVSTTPNLVKMYEKLGFRKTNDSYTHPLYPDQLQVVMTINIYDVLPAKNVGPVVWNVVWKDVADYLIENNIGDIKRSKSSKAKLYRALAPSAVVQDYFVRRPRRRSKSS